VALKKIFVVIIYIVVVVVADDDVDDVVVLLWLWLPSISTRVAGFFLVKHAKILHRHISSKFVCVNRARFQHRAGS
jgi:hypothetical protein